MNHSPSPARAALAAALTLLWPSASPAAQPPARAPLPNFDARRDSAPPPAATAPARAEADARLRALVPTVRIERAPQPGAPKFLSATRGFLTGPAGEGGAVPLRLRSGPSAAARARALGAGDPQRGVKALLDEHRGIFGHGAEALAAARTTRDETHGRLRTKVWQQQLDGIAVHEAIFKAHSTVDGEVVNLSSSFLPDLPAAAAAGAPNRAARLANPQVSAAQAVAIAAGNVGEEIQAANVVVSDAPAGVEKKQRFRAPRILDVSAEYVWLPLDEGTLRLCWQVQLVAKSRGEMFLVLVDAETGEPLLRRGLTNYISDASYRVFTSDSPAPLSPGHPTPLSIQPPEVARTLVTTPALDLTASPNGWIDDGVNETRGNNVDAHTDLDANDIADTPRPQGAPNRVFDFPLDLTQPPSAYRDAAITQLFYVCNWMHDKLYALGFTEAAGNFQNNNFGRGGLGNDAVQADAQDGSGTNNANFGTPADGSPPRMQMFTFTGPTPDRDGDFDIEIVLHEYAHGLSNRLVGGGVGIGELQPAGMGEGWSDFYGIALLSEPGDDVHANYAAGAYATYEFFGMTTNYYFGIRRYPYSTDLAKNPLTLKDIDPALASPHTGIPLSPLFGASNDSPSEVHNQGEVWCVTLWEARAKLIAKHGYAVGNQLILQLVTDGMKLGPANPNFLQARDAIVQADLVLTGGANYDELWAAFAKRGMGASAFVPASTTTSGVIEAFDLPDDLSVLPRTGFTSTGPVSGPFSENSMVFTLLNTGENPVPWTATNTQSWLTLSTTSGTLAPAASTTVTATLHPAASVLLAGVYGDIVRFTNTVSTVAQARPFTLAIGQPDFFTELFDNTPNDTAGQSFTFTPNASPSGYAVRREIVGDFPTDPAGGTTVTLSDDSFTQVTLTGGASVQLYGTTYTSYFLGSNGYVTFGSGDINYVPSLATHFALPRVAARFRDLDPSQGGTVSRRQLADRVAVTFQDVPDFFGTALTLNNLQIELFFDGRIRITVLTHPDTGGLIGLSRGGGTPAGFAESDFSAYPTGERLTLTLPATTAEGAGVLTDQGVVALPQAAVADVLVALVSSDPTEISVPQSVTVLAGQTSAAFSPSVVDDGLLDGTQVVRITASAPSLGDGSATIAVADSEAAALTVGLPATANEGAGAVLGTLSVSLAPDKAVAVILASSDTAEATVPPSVVIPAGQTSVTFPVTILDDTRIDGPQNVTVTATVANWSATPATITIADNESRDLLLTLPTSVLEGSPGTATVSVAGTVVAPLTITLVSDNTAQVTVPATATIATGAGFANFAIVAVNDAVVDGTQTATITASAATFTSDSASVNAIDNEIDHFVVDPIASPQIRNVPFAATVTARNIDDLTITNHVGTLNFTGAGAAGAVPIAPASAGGFVNGVWRGNLTATAFDTAVVLTAGDGAGHTGASNPFDVGLGALDHFGWSAIASPRVDDVPFTATISAQDLGNNTVPTFTGSATLNCGPATKITGTGTGTSLFPLYTSSHDARTQCIYLPAEVGGPGRLVSLSLFVATAPGQTMNAWTIRLKHTTLASYAPAAWDASGWTVVHQSVPTITTTGWVTFPFTVGFDYDGTSNLLVDFSFNNTSFSSAGLVRTTSTGTTVRTIFRNTDSAFGDPTTWSGTTNPSPFTATQLPNLRLQYQRAVPLTPAVTGAFTAGIWTGAVAVNQPATKVALGASGSGIVGESNIFDVLGSPVLNVTAATDFITAGNFGGPFTPASASYTVANNGAGPMTWTATKAAPWLSVAPSGGTLAVGASTTVAATLAAATLDPGVHTDTLTFTNTTSSLGNTARNAQIAVTLPAPVLAAEPPFTGGTANTLAWSSVTGAQTYEIERATLPDFSDAVSSGPLAGTSRLFSSLPDGALQRYRVRTRRTLPGTPGAFSQTTQAHFETDAQSAVATTPTGEVVLTSGPSVPLAGRIANPSFEGGSLSGWSTDTNSAGLASRSTSGSAFAPLPTLGTFFAGLNTFHNTARTAGEYVRITQSVDFTGVTALVFDAVLGTAPGSTWSNNVRAEVRIDGTTVWSATAPGTLLAQSLDVSGYTGSHTLEFRAEVIVSGTFDAQWFVFDQVRAIGAGYLTPGTLTSPAIAPGTLHRWGVLSFTRDLAGAGSALTVDVLDASGTLLAANVASGTSLHTLPAVASQPTLKLRANLSTANSASTPRLLDWTLNFQLAAALDAFSAWSAPVTSTQDATGPAISVFPYATAAYGVRGTGADPAGIATLLVNGAAPATGNAFATWIAAAGSLAPGNHLVPISATDAAVPPNSTTGTASVFLATMAGDADADGLPDAWEVENGLDMLSAAGDHGALGDLDRDGLSNLLERAFGLAADVPNATGLPTLSVEINPADSEPYVILRHRRLLAPGTLLYSLELSTDLQTWTPATAADTEPAAPPVPNGDALTETVTLRLKPSLLAPGHTTSKVRVRVTVP